MTLDIVVSAFDDGATPEEIVCCYPSLRLADVYALIAYYLDHRTDVNAYLRDRERQAAEVRQRNEARFGNQGVRERLSKRRTEPSV